jgi:KaiC/GvpD/RAD55 family RecA-like ATPase
MTLEAGQRLGSSDVSPLGVSFIADNLIQLRYVDAGDSFERGIAVVKARGVKHQTNFWTLEIDTGGPRVVKRGTAAAPVRRHGRQTRPSPLRRSRGRR